ncbi:MAG: tetratricopeptide repeat protein [Rhizobacter sp.]
MNIPRPLLHGLLAIGAQLACLTALAQGPVTRDEHAAAQALQQVRLEALKDIQQKEADALRAQLAAMDKRLDDLNTHTGQGVDRLGVVASILGTLVTVLLAGLGLVGWVSVTRKTKAEAEEAASAWFRDKGNALEKRLQEIEEKALQAQHKMDSSAQGVFDHAEGVKQRQTEALEQLQADMGRRESSALAPAQSQEAAAVVKQRANELKKSPEASYAFDDWNTRAHAAYVEQKLEEAALLWKKASEAPNASALTVGKSLLNRGVTQGQLGQLEAEIATYNEALRRFGEATEPALREQVARAMVNRGNAEGRLGQHETAIATYNEVLRRFGEATEPALREQVARAMFNRGVREGLLSQHETEVATYNEVLHRFGEATEPALRKVVARAMVNRGVTEGQLGQHETEVATYNEVLRRFGEATEPALREQVDHAINGIGFQQICNGKALWSTDQIGSKSLWQAALRHFDRKRPANPTLCKGIEGCEGCCFDNSEGAANGSGGMARQDQATTGRGSAVEAVRQKHCCVGAGPRDGCKAADGVGHL